MTWFGVWRFLRTSAVIFAGIVAIPTAYIALQDANLTWQFYLAIPFAVIIAVGILYGALGRRWIAEIKAYPTLLARAANLEKQVGEYAENEQRLEAEASAAWDRGVIEGETRVYGAMIANANDVPVLTAVVNHMGTVAFLCDDEEGSPVEGARYLVVSEASRQAFGMVQVARYDLGRVCLVCVQATKPRFWTRMAERLDYDDRVPPGIALTHLSLEHRTADVVPAVIEDQEQTQGPEGESSV